MLDYICKMLKVISPNFLTTFVLVLINCLIVKNVKDFIHNKTLFGSLLFVWFVLNIALMFCVIPKIPLLNNHVIYMFVNEIYVAAIWLVYMQDISDNKAYMLVFKIILLIVPVILAFFTEPIYWNSIIVKMDNYQTVDINIFLYIILVIFMVMQMFIFNYVLYKFIPSEIMGGFELKNTNEIMALAFVISLLCILNQQDIMSEVSSDLLDGKKYLAYSQIHFFKLLVATNVIIILYSERHSIIKYFLE